MRAPLVVRRDAVEATISRFNRRALKWGTVDCVRIVMHTLHGLGISTAIAKGVEWKSEHGGIKALRSHGFTTLAGLMDGFGLQRIPYAMAVQGDVVGMVCEGEVWDMALTIHAGQGQLFGILDGVAQAMIPKHEGILEVWRADPCLR